MNTPDPEQADELWTEAYAEVLSRIFLNNLNTHRYKEFTREIGKRICQRIKVAA